MRLKLFLISCFVIFCTKGNCQIFKGIVLLSDLKNQPLKNVQVKSPFSNETASNDDGTFEISFYKKHIGDKVQLTIEKSGYEVINSDDLKLIIPRDQDNPLIIWMCRKGERDSLATIYYNISLERLTSVYKTKINKLKANSNDNNIIISDLNDSLDQAKKIAEDFSKKLSVLSFDTTSLLNNSLARLRENDINGALNSLPDTLLRKNVMDSYQEESDAFFLDSIKNKKLQNARKKLNTAIDAYMIKARLNILNYEFNNSENYYSIACSLDSSNEKNLMEFAEFLLFINKNTEATGYFNRCLQLNGNQKEVVDIYNDLGTCFLKAREFKLSEFNYRNAIVIEDSLIKCKIEFNYFKINELKNNLVALYIQLNNLNDAERLLNEISQNIEKDTDLYSSRFMGLFFSNLGTVESMKGNLLIGEDNLLKASNLIMPKHQDIVSLDNLIKYCVIVSSLIQNYSDQKKYDKIDSLAKTAFPIFNQAYNLSPSLFSTYLGLLYNGVGLMYEGKGIYNESLISYQLATCFFEENYDSSFAIELTATGYLNIGNTYLELDSFNEAEIYLNKCLDIRNQLINKDSSAYLPRYAHCLYLLGVLYFETGKCEKSKDYFLSALQYYSFLAITNSVYNQQATDINTILKHLINCK